MLNRSIQFYSENKFISNRNAVISKQQVLQKYMQCPFSIFWSTLIALIETEGLNN